MMLVFSFVVVLLDILGVMLRVQQRTVLRVKLVFRLETKVVIFRVTVVVILSCFWTFATAAVLRGGGGGHAIAGVFPSHFWRFSVALARGGGFCGGKLGRGAGTKAARPSHCFVPIDKADLGPPCSWGPLRCCGRACERTARDFPRGCKSTV